jgi:hypothetical protein
MKYAKLARTKNEAYGAAVEDLKKYSKQAEDVAGLESSEKLDALYKIERALKRALKAAQEQREMEQKYDYDKDVVWTIAEVVSLCRDMDGACEECPLYDKRERRCFRASDNGIAGASTPASWHVCFSPLLEGTPAGDWLEAFKSSHPCECCSSHGGHCDITKGRLPGRCNCKMTEVPAEWGSIVHD